MSTLSNFSIALQSPLLTQTLQLGGYDADLVTQPQSVLLGLRLLITVVPFVALVVSLLAVRAYPLVGNRLVQIKSEVSQLHKRKAALVTLSSQEISQQRRL